MVVTAHWCKFLIQNFIGIPSVEAETKPSNISGTSDSISFDFQTETPIVAGTEQYYKYLVQYRVLDSAEWQEDLPLIDHPEGFTVSRKVLSHTINNLTADTDYEVQIAVCRVWYDVRGECSVADDSDPFVIIRTGKNLILIFKKMMAWLLSLLWHQWLTIFITLYARCYGGFDTHTRTLIGEQLSSLTTIAYHTMLKCLYNNRATYLGQATGFLRIFT